MKRKMLLQSAACVMATLCCCLLLAEGAFAQTVTGTLSGRVTDRTGGVIPGVKVVIKSEQMGTVREVSSNEEGYYFAPFLNIGAYDVTVEYQGFQTVTKKGVLIELNRNTVSDFALEPASVAATVEVTGETPQIETTVGEVKHSLDVRAIDNTPVAGRNFISLVEQIPGFQNAPFITSSNNPTNSTGSYAAFSGTGSRSATFQIDGVNNDDSSENQNRQNVNLSAIKELQVLTNAYSAEFGRAGGAVILVQTKSGANDFHGDVYNYMQNEVFNANGYFSNRAGLNRQRVRRHQYGWTVGGPVLPDKLFFFHSGERLHNKGSSNITRFFFFPNELTARACNPGEIPRPLGPYCLDPADHPNLAQDIAQVQAILDLYNTPFLQNATSSDPTGACNSLVASGRPNRCITVTGLPNSLPVSDYSGKLDWNAPWNTVMALRYQYSRQILDSPRIILGDNFGLINNRQYNIGYTATKAWGNRQAGEFRYGFGNRTTLQNVADGNNIPIIRFGNTLAANPIIGTSANVPINRRQHDHQFVYNHTVVFNRHTLRAGIDQRFSLHDDLASATHRGFWTFSSVDSTACIANPMLPQCLDASGQPSIGFTGWENLLRGFFTAFQKGFGDPVFENRYGETNLYVQDDLRWRPNLTINLGFRWEGVRAPNEKEDRLDYGFGGDYNNFEPRIGFAWTPAFSEGWLGRVTGGAGNFVIRGGYGLYHSRLFQSVFSQSGLNFRAQPPNGFFFTFSALTPCTLNIEPRFEVADPTCGFTFTPGAASFTTPTACSLTPNGCGPAGAGVKVAENRLQTGLLQPDPNLQVPYVQQWNLTVERKLPWRMALQVSYNGNRGIGYLFYDNVNRAQFPIMSPVVTVDVGGGNFQPVVFDRVCVDFSDPICVVPLPNGQPNPATSGAFRNFSALTSTTATLAQKGIVIVGGVPHGYISSQQTRTNERRPDPNFLTNFPLRNFGWSYYHAMVIKVSKQYSQGLNFSGFYTWSKAIDTGSDATFTGTDTNSPVGTNRNPARSLRGLSSFHAEHRVVINYGYDLPWYRSQLGWAGRVLGGWSISGVTTLQSGNPFTILAGYDVNFDGGGGDRPAISDLSFLYRSVDNGRAQNPCPVATTPCPNTMSELQLPGSIFVPGQAAVGIGDQRFFDPGGDGTGTIGRNTFFGDGLNNFDVIISKKTRIAESMELQLRMEWYNIFNRVTFDVPSSRTLNASVTTAPIGRITGQRNPFNYVNSFRDNGSRMGQLAIRFIF